MKKLALELDTLLVESFDTTPAGRVVMGGTVRAHDSRAYPVDENTNSGDGTCWEAGCNNNTAGGENTCDTGCGGTQYVTCNPTEANCVVQTDNTCYGYTCYGVSCGPAGSCSQGCYV
ncbi:hypothetical protein [Longimicrobium sp.]|uniref:hypothetical protein n=1 Tax=Longimicrobium sp. TaxID=2029185 RepID=UPI002C3BF1ED|nr:hypothetical protein [Longimicrobium sp.]HSU15850.1 hypothetical protein [Longimicrobium sp.]